MRLIDGLGIFSGVLQAAGYFFYIRKAIKGENTPNPFSWLMFAYGTLLLLLLEFDRDTQLALLILPVVCALSSLVVVRFCWIHGGFKTPLDWTDTLAFMFDIGLTICYMIAWVLMGHGVINSQERMLANLVILVCWNAGVFTSFTPLLRGVKHDPKKEHPLPWCFWATAYTVLGVATFAEYGFHHLELLLYPGINALVHGRVAIMTQVRRSRA